MAQTGETAPVITSEEEAIALLGDNLSTRDQILAIGQDLERQEVEIEAQITALKEQAKQIDKSQNTNRELLKLAREERNKLLNFVAQTLPFDEAFEICSKFSDDLESTVAQERALIERLNALAQQEGNFPALVIVGDSEDFRYPRVMVVTMAGFVKYERNEGIYAEMRSPRLCIEATGKKFFTHARMRDHERMPEDVVGDVYVDGRTIITDPTEIMDLIQQKLPFLTEEHSDDQLRLAEDDFVLLATLYSAGLLNDAQVNKIRNSQTINEELRKILWYAFDGPSTEQMGNMIDVVMFFLPVEEGTGAKEMYLASLKQAKGSRAGKMTVAEVQAFADIANKRGLSVTTNEIVDYFLAVD